MKDFLEHHSWIDRYEQQMSFRYPTMRTALNLLYQLNRPVTIVETGTVRQVDDWGAGYSTFIWGQFCQNEGGMCTTIDISEHNMEVCRKVTEPYKNFITYVVEDSLTALAKLNEPIDLLYLDSLDVPLEAGADLRPCQEHNLKELQIAEHLLHSESLVLIDDNFENGGKGKLTKAYLREKGWRALMFHQQCLFMR